MATAIAQLGIGAELAKADIKSAYRLVPVHPEDRPLMAMQWEESVYVTVALPFGLCSAPTLFNVVADALEWYTKNAGTKTKWHYLDDFITIGSAVSGVCAVFHHI